MAENTLDVRIRQRCDAEENWIDSDPVLLEGEMAVSLDKNGQYKMGDGTSKWSELSYNAANTLYGLTASVAELNYVKGVTSSIQTQLNNKSASDHTHDYLPLTGGTLTGALLFNDGLGEITANANAAFLKARATKGNTNVRTLFVATHTFASAISSALKLRDITDGVYTDYLIYGQHNKPTARDVGALALTGGTVTGDTDIQGGARFRYYRTNTIGSTDDDTTANWRLQGCSVHTYNTSELLYSQPSKSGFLLNLSNGTPGVDGTSSDVHQLWFTQPTGNLCHRGGNGTGWNGNSTVTTGAWRTLLDSTNYSSYALPLSGGTVTGTLVLSKATDLSGTANNSPALIIGGTDATAHIEIDANEIHAKATGTTVGVLNLNTDGGLVSIGSGGIRSGGDIYPSTALTKALGTATYPWNQVVARYHYMFDANKVQTGYLGSVTAGTTTVQGESYCIVGNNKATAAAGNARGRLRLYNQNTGYTDIVGTSSTAHRTITLPNATGTVALMSNLNRTNSVNEANTAYTTYMARGIAASTTDLTAGKSTMTNGCIYLVYE